MLNQPRILLLPKQTKVRKNQINLLTILVNTRKNSCRIKLITRLLLLKSKRGNKFLMEGLFIQMQVKLNQSDPFVKKPKILNLQELNVTIQINQSTQKAASATTNFIKQESKKSVYQTLTKFSQTTITNQMKTVNLIKILFYATTVQIQNKKVVV